jgi:hypothetical protein
MIATLGTSQKLTQKNRKEKLAIFQDLENLFAPSGAQL